MRVGKITDNAGNEVTGEDRKLAISLAKQGLAIGASAVIVTLVKYGVIAFALYLLGKYLRLI